MADNVTAVRDTLKKIQKNLECPICLELLSDPYTTQCSHPFCRTCIYTVISTNKRARCPLCKEPITKRSMNENTRLSEIIEAVKELEQAIIEDTGIPTTPPRPIPAHSHEATGTPGVIIHSLLHPTPVKQHPQAEQTESYSHSTQCTNETASQSTIESGGSNICQATTSSIAPQDTPSSSKHFSSTTLEKSENDHRKLSIKRRRKKKVKFSMEKPAIPEPTKQVRSSSPLTVEKVQGATSLVALTAETYGIGNRKESKDVVEKGLMLLTEQQKCLPNSAETNNTSEGEVFPVRKKAKMEAETNSSQQLQISSQLIGHNVPETPAPIDIAEPMEFINACDELSSSIGKSRHQKSGLFLSQNNQSEHCNESTSFAHHSGSVSPQSGTTSPIMLSQQEPAPPSFTTETPFVQPTKIDNGSVRRVLETPFVSNIQVMDDNDGQDECILAKDTQPTLSENLVLNNTLPDETVPIDMDKEEEHSSDSILARDSEDSEAHHHSPQASQFNLDADMDDSCTVLGPTPVKSVPETQFNRPATAGRLLSLPLSQTQSVKSTTDDVGGVLSEHASISTSSSTQSYHGSPFHQSLGTVCIGETQYTKSSSQDKKCSPSEFTSNIMPSPPASPSEDEIQSPIIPLQNSLSKDMGTSSNHQSPVRKSTITDSASLETPVVPCSQPSPPFSKRQRESLFLPGLSARYHRDIAADIGVPLDEDKGKETEGDAESQTLGLVTQQTEPDSPRMSNTSGNIVQSPLEENTDIDLTKAPAIELQGQKEEIVGPVAQAGCTQKTGAGFSAASIGLAFSNLQSQRDNLLSQISCSVDLSSQQLEQLRVEMEAKQREIDELEAALEQVQMEENHRDAITNTQSSVKSITAIADTLPISSSFTVVASEQQEKSPEQPVESELECDEKQLSAVHTNSLQSSSNSQTEKEEPVRMTSPTVTVVETIQRRLSDAISPQTLMEVAPEPTSCSSKKERPSQNLTIIVSSPISSHTAPDARDIEVPTSPHAMIEPVPELTSKSNHEQQSCQNLTVNVPSVLFHTATDAGDVEVQTSPQTKIESGQDLTSHEQQSYHGPTVDVSSVQSHTLTGARDVDTPSSTQSVEAVLQAADEVLRKLKNPPLAVLEERSSLEIDKDLCSSVNIPSHASVKAKLQITTSSSNATSRAHVDKGDEGQPLWMQVAKKSNDKTEKELKSELSARTSASIENTASLKSATTALKRVQERTKKKKKKTALVLLEQESTQPIGVSSPLSSHPATAEMSSPNIPSVGEVCGSRQSSGRAHSSRDIAHSTVASPQYQSTAAGLLQTPKLMGQRRSGDMPVVSPCRPLCTIGKDHPPSYVGSGLSKHQLREIQTLARRYGGRLASCFNGSTSHVIVNTDKDGYCSRTIKYLQGVATGRWIVSHQWVSDSLQANRLLSEAEYEIVGDHVTSANTCAPMKSRQLHQNESPGLFADCAFLFVGVFDNISQNHLAQLIQLSGGSLVSSMDDPGVSPAGRSFVVSEEKRAQFINRSDWLQVNSEWVLDCLSNYCILPPPSLS